MTELDHAIIPHKFALIDEALARYDIKSFVDLGGCWAVNGGYTFHALQSGRIERAVLVDGAITELTHKRAEPWPQLELVEAPLGEQETVTQVGTVDAAIMFDILLHQVAPDWDEFLKRYARNVDTLIIHNQGWLGSETVRFPNFDVDEFLSRTYHSDEKRVREWYDQHSEWNDEQGKLWRDVHNFWQWGITEGDLVGTLWNLGYRIDYLFNKGVMDERFSEIEVVGLIARKRELPHPFVGVPVTWPVQLAEASPRELAEARAAELDASRVELAIELGRERARADAQDERARAEQARAAEHQARADKYESAYWRLHDVPPMRLAAALTRSVRRRARRRR